MELQKTQGIFTTFCNQSSPVAVWSKMVDCCTTGHARSRRQRCRRGIFGSSTGSAKPINRGVAAWFENAEGKLFSVLREMFEVVAYCALIGLTLIIYAPTFQQCVCCSFSRETFYCQVFSRALSPMTSKFVVEVQTRRKGSGLRALENIGNHTGWCPPVISWFIIPINYYSYICHKP